MQQLLPQFSLPPTDTLQGDLRFNIDMVRAQLRLYSQDYDGGGHAASGDNGNGGGGGKLSRRQRQGGRRHSNGRGQR